MGAGRTSGYLQLMTTGMQAVNRGVAFDILSYGQVQMQSQSVPPRESVRREFRRWVEPRHFAVRL
jgi:hypothetical protein